MIVFAILLILIVCFAVRTYSQFLGPEKTKEKERFIIKQETSEGKIIADLKEKGFLKNKSIFNFILSLKGWHKKIEPGAYLLSKGMNAYELAGALVYGPFQKWVLIPPGKRKEQTALILKRTLDWPDQIVLSFIKIAQEGYLFPDSYLINTDADPQQVVKKLLSNFNEKFDTEIENELLKQNIRNDTAIKIASLIERESGSDEDKSIIAGVIWNRLNKKMKLEIDATVQYAIISQQISDLVTSRQLPATDFNFWPTLGPGIVRTVDSLYNTYKIKALPPGPICSPGLASIKAVVYPADTDALYYLHSPDKKIHTAKTYKEHRENIEKYLN